MPCTTLSEYRTQLRESHKRRIQFLFFSSFTLHGVCGYHALEKDSVGIVEFVLCDFRFPQVLADKRLVIGVRNDNCSILGSHGGILVNPDSGDEL